MIIVFSEIFDMSTDAVCEWLYWYDQPFVRINGTDFARPSDQFTGSLSLSNTGGLSFSFVINGKKIAADAVNAVWFRRDEPFKREELFDKINDNTLRIPLVYHAGKERVRAREFFHTALLEKPHLGNHHIKEVNKFEALYHASRNGLHIPDTLLSSDPAALSGFVSKNESITKAIRETDFFKSSSGEVFVSYTAGVQKKDLGSAAFPVLLQKKVEKVFEIRSYFFKGRFYSMAIFSQSDHKTEVDYRRYNIENPNRNVPYRLPHQVETGLQQTMEALGLDNGSIDLIKTTDGKFVFLEVNPVGQFGMTSKPCNYYIEKDIAEWLTAQASNKNN